MTMLTDERYERTKAQILAWHDEWVSLLGLGYWHVDYLWNREGIRSQLKTRPDDTPLMTCIPDWAYQNATIEIDMPRVADLLDCSDNPDEPEISYLHELTHCLVEPAARPSGTEISEEQQEYEVRLKEMAVTQISRAFYRLRRRDREARQRLVEIHGLWSLTYATSLQALPADSDKAPLYHMEKMMAQTRDLEAPGVLSPGVILGNG